MWDDNLAPFGFIFLSCLIRINYVQSHSTFIIAVVIFLQLQSHSTFIIVVIFLPPAPSLSILLSRSSANLSSSNAVSLPNCVRGTPKSTENIEHWLRRDNLLSLTLYRGWALFKKCAFHSFYISRKEGRQNFEIFRFSVDAYCAVSWK